MKTPPCHGVWGILLFCAGLTEVDKDVVGPYDPLTQTTTYDSAASMFTRYLFLASTLGVETIMGWIQDQFNKRIERSETEPAKSAASETNAPQSDGHEIVGAWRRLLQGFRQDTEEFQALGGDCDLQQFGELQCRIRNPTANIAVLVTADLSGRTVEYSYESENEKTAVPEKGILTMRRSAGSVDLYSADQQLSSEQARRQILEPLLFPTWPSDLAATGT